LPYMILWMPQTPHRLKCFCTMPLERELQVALAGAHEESDG